MRYFTNSPYERMMQEVPRARREDEVPPVLPGNSRARHANITGRFALECYAGIGRKLIQIEIEIMNEIMDSVDIIIIICYFEGVSDGYK